MTPELTAGIAGLAGEILHEVTSVSLVVATATCAVDQEHKGHRCAAWWLFAATVIGILVISILWGIDRRLVDLLTAGRPAFDP